MVDKGSSWGFNLEFAEALTRKWVAEQEPEVQEAFENWHDRSKPCAEVIPLEHLQLWRYNESNFTHQEAEAEAERRMKCVSELLTGPYVPHTELHEAGPSKQPQSAVRVEAEKVKSEPSKVAVHTTEAVRDKQISEKMDLIKLIDDASDEPLNLSKTAPVAVRTKPSTTPNNKWPFPPVPNPFVIEAACRLRAVARYSESASADVSLKQEDDNSKPLTLKQQRAYYQQRLREIYPLQCRYKPQEPERRSELLQEQRTETTET